MSATGVVRFGLAGLGGYAAAILDVLTQCEKPEGDEPALVQLVAACEPAEELHRDKIAQLRARGVKVYRTFPEMLGQRDVEAVWLPVPIDLHRPFTEQALAAGKAVMCEKPAAGCVDDLDAMIRARDAAGLPVAIGFQDIYSRHTLPVKRLLQGGAIGTLRHVTLWATWPRGDDYYSRNNWAGRLQRNGVWVLDSPANNALAHFINLALFYLGATPEQSARPVRVEAELYRARDIENYDTCSLRIHTAEGPSVLVLLSHAAEQNHHPSLTVHGSSGRLHWQAWESFTVQTLAGAVTQTLPCDSRQRRHMTQRFCAEVRRADPGDCALATLEVARAHLVVVNGASEAAVVRSIPAEAIRVTPTGVRAIPGIAEIFAQCAARNQMLHESGLLPWTQPAGVRDLRDYRRFAGPARA